MKKGLNAISEKTTKLWNKLNEKYGNHVYTLGVNGLDEVILCKGYTEEIAHGNVAVLNALRELLKEER